MEAMLKLELILLRVLMAIVYEMLKRSALRNHAGSWRRSINSVALASRIKTTFSTLATSML